MDLSFSERAWCATMILLWRAARRLDLWIQSGRGAASRRIETMKTMLEDGFGGGGGGGGREPFGGATDDVDGSGVQAMISSWMQNVDFSQFAAAAETDPPVVEIKKPEKRGIVGFFQRRFGRKDHSTAVSANTSPGVVVHQHIHHVVHHVVHEMR